MTPSKLAEVLAEAKVHLKLLWIECVLASNESTHTKLFLLVIGRYFSREGRSSSMSYAQIERECSMSHKEAMRCAKRAKGRWLRVGVHKGARHAGGNCNLYCPIIPADMMSVAAEKIAAWRQRSVQQTPPENLGRVHQTPVQERAKKGKNVEVVLPTVIGLGGTTSGAAAPIQPMQPGWGELLQEFVQ
jgi:hypothetical protein